MKNKRKPVSFLLAQEKVLREDGVFMPVYWFIVRRGFKVELSDACAYRFNLGEVGP